MLDRLTAGSHLFGVVVVLIATLPFLVLFCDLGVEQLVICFSLSNTA